MTSHAAGDALTIACPAKVNLALSVGAPDATGYHPIATWMVALDFADTLRLRKLETNDPGTESDYEIRFADDAPVTRSAIDWPLEQDLTWRAHRALERSVGRALPIHLSLQKRVPTGAGLGGGSSDAAGMLHALNVVFGLELSVEALCEHAAALGSDVPFFVRALHGEPALLASGRGERLEPAPLSAPAYLVLVLPPLSCATGEVYAAFDQMADANGSAADEARVRELAGCGTLADDALFNDLAEPACRVCPALMETMQRLARASGRRVHVTGSGAAMFVLARDAGDAAQLARRIGDATALTALATRTLDTSDSAARRP